NNVSLKRPYNMEHTQDTDSVASSSTAVNYNTQYGQSSSTIAAPTDMPLAYPLLAEALGREGFPGFASVLAFTQDQRQLEQSLEHQPYSTSSSTYQQEQPIHLQQQQQQQQHHPLQDDSYLLDFVVQEHNMLMAQHGYNSSSSSASSSNTPYSQGQPTQNNDPAVHDPYSVTGDMQPFEVLQYNSLVLDSQYFDAYSIMQGGCGGDGPGMDASGWCDTGLAGSNYINDQYSHPVQQIPQPPQQYQQGYFDTSVMPMSSGSSSAGPSTSPSSAPPPSYGFNYPAWSAAHAGLLYPQGDFLLERKREGATGLPPTRVQPHLESAEVVDETDDEDDDDDDVFCDAEEEVPAMIMHSDHQHHHHHIHNHGYNNNNNMTGFQSNGYQVDDSLPGLAMPGRSTRHNSYGQKHDRDDDRVISPSSKRSRSDATTTAAAVAAAAAAATVAAQRRASAGAALNNNNNSHSRNSSMSSIHSHSDNSLSSPSSSAGSPTNGRGSSSSSRQQADTIEKRMHPCTFEGCHKSFTRAFNLRSHLNTHNGERPHKCPEAGCEWDFVRRHDLDRH
ncbi:Krueppel-like factor 5, partial [Entomortierella lignicola]